MRKKMLAAVLGITLLLSAGCTKSNIIRPEGKAEPDFSIVTDVELNWEQIGQDLMGYYEDSTDYPGLSSFNYNHKDEEKLILVQLFVEDSVNPNQAAAYASDLIKFLNDSITIQNNSYALSGDDFYGGFFDEYNVSVQVFPEETPEDEDTCLVNMTVNAGEHSPIVPVEAP